MSEPKCVPLCGATKAYGRYDKWWYHEPQCPVRLAHDYPEEYAAQVKRMAQPSDTEDR